MWVPHVPTTKGNTPYGEGSALIYAEPLCVDNE